jgi:hypothetical protein
VAQGHTKETHDKTGPADNQIEHRVGVFVVGSAAICALCSFPGDVEPSLSPALRVDAIHGVCFLESPVGDLPGCSESRKLRVQPGKRAGGGDDGNPVLRKYVTSCDGADGNVRSCRCGRAVVPMSGPFSGHLKAPIARAAAGLMGSQRSSRSSVDQRMLPLTSSGDLARIGLTMTN